MSARALAITLMTFAAACSPVQEARETAAGPTVSVATAEPTGTALAPDPVVFSPKGKLGEVVTVPASKSSPQVDARALVWRARPDETLALALRYGPPASPQEEKRGFGDSDAHLEKLEIELTSPDGHQQLRTVRFPSKPPAQMVSFWPARTLVFEIGESGVRVKWPARLSAPYDEGALVRSDEGTWHVASTSHVTLPNLKSKVTLRSGRVPFDVRATHPKRAALMAAAEPERKKAGASDQHEPGVEGGFVADTLIQLSDDRWVARYAKPAIWAFALTSVYLSPGGAVLSAETIDIDTCIAQSMRVDTPAGPRRVEELRVGDVVWAWSLLREVRVPTEVKSIVAYPARPTVWLGELQLSPTHPVWDDGEWRAAGELPSAIPGDPATVYAITVDAPHTFFAEGQLVHNKDRSYSDRLDDPWMFMWTPKKEWWKEPTP